MGRYYQGDIEGKFVFGSQSSGAADRFGVAGHTPGYLEYYYTEADLPDLESELKKIENSFKKYKIPLLAYYDLFGVNDDVEISFEEYIQKGGFKAMNAKKQFDFNDYRIGRKILDCIKEHGECSFTAEL
jgi:hypothetical protein